MIVLYIKKTLKKVDIFFNRLKRKKKLYWHWYCQFPIIKLLWNIKFNLYFLLTLYFEKDKVTTKQVDIYIGVVKCNQFRTNDKHSGHYDTKRLIMVLQYKTIQQVEKEF